jgi:hypothetical protein
MYHEIGKGVFALKVIGVKEGVAYEVVIRFSTLQQASSWEDNILDDDNARLWIPAGREQGVRIDTSTIVYVVVIKE